MTRQIAMPASSTAYEYIVLEGGYDLLTPPLKLKPGYVRDAINFEHSINGGYSRCGGYERYDGRPGRPSLASYGTIRLASVGAIAVGATITGAVSGATGKVIDIEGDVYAYTQLTGGFLNGENVTVAAVVQGIIVEIGGAGAGADYDARMTALAANVYRALIAAVPGSGPVRGVARLNGVTYAWRNNVGGTAMAIYKSTNTGWALVPMLLRGQLGGRSQFAGASANMGAMSSATNPAMPQPTSLTK